MSKYINKKTKQQILEQQNGKCANHPGANLRGIRDHECLLWHSKHKGSFVNDDYEIDHIIEFAISQNNDISNLQALCTSCHKHKSKWFMKNITEISESVRYRGKDGVNDYDKINFYVHIETDKYNVFDNKELQSNIYGSLNRSIHDCTNLLYFMNKDTYGTIGKTWYMFYDHKWNIITFDTMINNIMEFVRKCYDKLLLFYLNNDSKMKYVMTEIIDKCIKRYDNKTFKRDVINRLKSQYIDASIIFEQQLNANNNLIGYNNGTYDIKHNTFRKGLYNDYISMSVNYDFTVKYSSKHKYLTLFLDDILQDESIKQNVLQYVSLCLSENMNDIMSMVFGGDMYSVSSFTKLIERTLGDYFVVFNKKLITSPDEHPVLHKSILYKRFVVTTLSNDDVVNSNAYMKFCSNNSLKIKNVSLKQSHKTVIISNKPIKFNRKCDEIALKTHYIEFSKISFGIDIDRIYPRDFMLLLIETHIQQNHNFKIK